MCNVLHAFWVAGLKITETFSIGYIFGRISVCLKGGAEGEPDMGRQNPVS